MIAQIDQTKRKPVVLIAFQKWITTKVRNKKKHEIMLFCDLFQGEVAVCVHPALPMGGVTMILGHDIAGSRVWADIVPLGSSAPG